MVPTIAPLTGADEYLNHQVAQTFGTVGTSDHGWTEKVWFMLARQDGSLQASFGLGKYTNRNLIDGFAGVQIGTQQRTVRASRVLRPNLDLAVGPLRYEIIEPMKKLRLGLAPNAAQPISFDLVWTAHLPAFFEGRDYGYAAHRNSSDVVRYHQAGTVAGWIEIDGVRHVVEPGEWFGFRDHSWGVREHVGMDPADLPPAVTSKIAADYQFNWLVSSLTRPDGSRYELAYYFREFRAPRGLDWYTAWINEESGQQSPILQVWPQLTYRRSDNAVMGGTIHCLMRGPGKDPVERVFEVEAINSEMGFRLNPGMYGPWKGQIHGSYMGEDFLDGECIDDVNNPEKFAASRRWEIRDRPLRIREGDAVGFADIESIVIGDWDAATFV